jgi:hypothetical protein
VAEAGDLAGYDGLVHHRALRLPTTWRLAATALGQ